MSNFCSLLVFWLQSMGRFYRLSGWKSDAGFENDSGGQLAWFLILLGGLTSDLSAASLVVVGSPGAELSSHDIEDIQRLSRSEGGEPWLFIGEGGQRGRIQIIRAFCVPEKGSDRVRRGVLVHIARESLKGGEGIWLPWRLLGSERWAQVAIEGRRFGDVKDERDYNRPFAVKGKFSDEELTRIVRFVRSNPILRVPPMDPEGKERSIQVDGSLPIWWVKRTNGQVEVNLLKGRDRGFQVYLEERAGEWRVSKMVTWIR